MLACVIVHITTMKLSDLFEVIYVGMTVRKCTAVRCLYATYRTSSKSGVKILVLLENTTVPSW